MRYRCQNDPFGYCVGEPRWVDPDRPVSRSGPVDTGRGYEEHPIQTGTPGNCELDPATCGYYRTESELTAAMRDRDMQREYGRRHAIQR